MEKFFKRYIQHTKRCFTVAICVLAIGSGLISPIRSQAQSVSTDTQAIINATNDSSSNIQMTIAFGFGSILFLATAILGFNYAKKI